MKVVFLEEVEGTARIGEVKNVADGFARNYLLPRRLAAPATPHYVTIAQARAEKEAKRQAHLDEEAEQYLLPKVEGQAITVEVRVGEQGKLFGSATPRDIAEALTALTGIELEHRQVALGQPIRELGTYRVPIRLTRNVHAEITVNVVPLGGVIEEAEAAAAAEPVEAVEAEEPVAEAGEEAEAEAVTEAEVEEEASEEAGAAEEEAAEESEEPAVEAEAESEEGAAQEEEKAKRKRKKGHRQSV